MQTTTLTAPATFRGRRSNLIFDVVGEMRRKGTVNFFYDHWKRYGDFSALQLRSELMFLAVHPDMVRYINVTARQNFDKGKTYDGVRKYLLGDGIVTAVGESWRWQRKLMSPFFTPRGIESYYGVIASDATKLAADWRALAKSGRTVEIKDEMMRVTASIILRTVFGTESSQEVVEIGDAITEMLTFTTSRDRQIVDLPLSVPLPSHRRYVKARDKTHKYVAGLIAQRHAIPEADRPDDLLSKLIATRDDETGRAMSDALLQDNAITMFFAGHETTATTLAFMFYLLALHPDVAERMRAEINANVKGDTPTLDELKRLGYVLQVLKETLRLYPAAPMYVRDSVNEDVIEGMRVPPKTRVMLMPFATHRHPDFWPDPEKFDPDRWTPEREAKQHPFAWHPFAAGQRICLGNSFSLLESHIIATMLVREFAPRLNPTGHRVELNSTATLHAKNGIPMVIGAV